MDCNMNSKPITRTFLVDNIRELYLNLHREVQLLAVFVGSAVFLACLGLIGIAISTAERRTKEIGIRKTMGASTGEIVALLLWQFAMPMLWADFMAWPLAGWLMRRWLDGFAYHVTLHTRRSAGSDGAPGARH
jgi:putative ABC transport system permease protein